MQELSQNTLIFLDYFFSYLSHGLYLLYFSWVDMEKDQEDPPLMAFLTVFSWVVLGAFYGWGYCVLTDWHWDVRRALNDPPQSHSYTHFLIRKITGFDLSPGFVDRGMVIILAICLLLSIWLYLRDLKRKNKAA